MQHTINQYRLVKEPVDSKVIELPERTVYYFEIGLRRSLKIVPVYTTWQQKRFNKPEEIWKYEVTCVHLLFNTMVEKFDIHVSDLEKIYHDTKHPRHSFIKNWLNDELQSRTEAEFNSDLTLVLAKITQ